MKYVIFNTQTKECILTGIPYTNERAPKEMTDLVKQFNSMFPRYMDGKEWGWGYVSDETATKWGYNVPDINVPIICVKYN